MVQGETMKQVVKPIKNRKVLEEVKNCLLNDFDIGRRNYTIFQVGKATLLRVSDVLRLKKTDVYDNHGRVKRNAYIIDKKTKKRNVLYLGPVERDLEDYFDWLEDFESEHPQKLVFDSIWLFPSMTHPNKHIDERRFYMIMHKVAQKLEVDYLGTHTMRKTGAYMVYQQSNYNITLVSDLLNHSSEKQTFRYLGLDQETRENILDTIDFG